MAMRLGFFTRRKSDWLPGVGEKEFAVNQQSQADFWEAKAAAAESQVRNVKDPLAMDSWLMIADSCRQLAEEYRELEGRKATRAPRLW